MVVFEYLCTGGLRSPHLNICCTCLSDLVMAGAAVEVFSANVCLWRGQRQIELTMAKCANVRQAKHKYCKNINLVHLYSKFCVCRLKSTFVLVMSGSGSLRACMD